MSRSNRDRRTACGLLVAFQRCGDGNRAVRSDRSARSKASSRNARDGACAGRAIAAECVRRRAIGERICAVAWRNCRNIRAAKVTKYRILRAGRNVSER